MQDQIKVCSFCESHDHLLMWSRYANYRTGFCVEYDIAQWKNDDLRRRSLYPAIYQDSRYDATDNLLQNQSGNCGLNPLYAIISGSTKPSEWSYEQNFLDLTKQFVANQLPEKNGFNKVDQVEILRKSVDYLKKHTSYNENKFAEEV